MRSPGTARSAAACSCEIDDTLITFDAPGFTASLSTFGPPLAVVAVARIVLEPAFKLAVAVAVCQVVQEPVPGNASSSATSAPLTLMSIGRFVVAPLAKPNASVAVPAAAAFTVHST